MKRRLYPAVLERGPRGAVRGEFPFVVLAGTFVTKNQHDRSLAPCAMGAPVHLLSEQAQSEPPPRGPRSFSCEAF